MATLTDDMTSATPTDEITLGNAAEALRIEEKTMAKYDKADLERRMHGAVESLKSDLAGLRTGRAHTALLDPVTVEVYGAQMPLNQVASVSAPEARMLTVQVWDKSNVGPVDKAIRSAGLGLNPIVDGQMLRLPIPEMTQERRKELSKLAGKYAEAARVAVRNVRRDGEGKGNPGLVLFGTVLSAVRAEPVEAPSFSSKRKNGPLRLPVCGSRSGHASTSSGRAEF